MRADPLPSVARASRSARHRLLHSFSYTLRLNGLLCWDADGNLSSKRSTGSCTSGTVTQSFTFDALNQLREVSPGAIAYD